MADTSKLMKALTIQVHCAAWERKTRKYGASPNQTSNFIQQLQMDLESSDDQQNKMKDLVTSVLNDMLKDSGKEIPVTTDQETILAQDKEIKRLQAAIQ